MELQPDGTYKVTVKMSRRSDGGLRAWSEQVPGFLLSHKNPDMVLKDIEPALTFVLSEMLGSSVTVQQLEPLPIFAAHLPWHYKLKKHAVSVTHAVKRLLNHGCVTRLEYATHSIA